MPYLPGYGILLFLFNFYHVKRHISESISHIQKGMRGQKIKGYFFTHDVFGGRKIAVQKTGNIIGGSGCNFGKRVCQRVVKASSKPR